jgi:hypothetical protein
MTVPCRLSAPSAQRRAMRAGPAGRSGGQGLDAIAFVGNRGDDRAGIGGAGDSDFSGFEVNVDPRLRGHVLHRLGDGFDAMTAGHARHFEFQHIEGSLVKYWSREHDDSYRGKVNPSREGGFRPSPMCWRQAKTWKRP